ncbi:hypothetical protein CYMTET_22315 [Cymbomonas tetramitiformis]|uniref:Uncharacterized protein n=1 Tax=Cymbomonas tetramitiformis TaxID=36881 RepID=A0AAE0G093_9CHLO|nr:hypothetical protein CYMTET_22315 [Cymbomonas tetramitiformis]
MAYALSGSAGAVEGATGGRFDMYLFAQSWAPRFCCSQKEKCESQGIQDAPSLSTHGLWPSYDEPTSDGHTFPAFCAKRQKGGGEFDLAEHEWQKHGTCTGLTRDKYFEEEHRVVEKLSETGPNGSPQILLDHAGGALGLESVREAYAHSVGLQLDGFCRLREVTTCFSKNRDGTVGEQVDCPPHVLEGSRNLIGDCQKVYLDQAGKCAFITKSLLQSMKEGSD